jgi:hypothetical protein
VLLAALGSPAAAQEKAEPTVERIRSLLNVHEFKEQYRELIGFGEAAFPAYEQILNDPAANSMEVVGIFCVLGGVQADRRRFIEPAVRRLTEPSRDRRLSAVQILGRIGSRGDASPVVALLWDEERPVVRAAAEALCAIGGERELTALDIWIKAGNHRTDGDLRRIVQQYRNQLQRRVEEEKKQTKNQS